VRVFLEEVVLDGPGLVEAELVRKLHLFEGVVVDLVLGLGVPGLADRKLVEDAEFHQGVMDHAGRGRRIEPRLAEA
jgi:hypothetical protein